MSPVKRTLPALEFTNSPLIIALAQVRMTPVLSLENYIPKLQDLLRATGYPRLIKRVIKATRQDAIGKMDVIESTDWVFGDKAGHFALLVGERGLGLFTSSYHTFEDFAGRLNECLQLVHQVVNINGVERLGLRYVDLIEPTPEKPLSYFLESCVLGLPLQELGKRVSGLSQTIIETSPHQKLVVRTTERSKGLVIPPDLLSLQLKLRKPNTLEQPFGILDLDHFAEYPETDDYDTASVIRKFGELHDIVDQAFRKATTDDAKSDWK
ncbi:MAG: hypothetical protein CFE26_04990 [Verrucomicrobiales bacterium VVV1]|nr:MAG: hypothetical protein CFE26_04990 [Verrucomicrobiales bacterium VVV1]